MLPYRTVENVIDGIVVSFVDITALKEVEKIAADARAFAETITDTIREALLVLDGNLKVVSANKVFYRNFEITREKTEGGHIFSLGNGQWDIPRLRNSSKRLSRRSLLSMTLRWSMTFQISGTGEWFLTPE